MINEKDYTTEIQETRQTLKNIMNIVIVVQIIILTTAIGTIIIPLFIWGLIPASLLALIYAIRIEKALTKRIKQEQKGETQ